jgi:small subunit ribosomal protein S16
MFSRFDDLIGGDWLAVRIRLQRHGRRNLPFYRVVVVDSRSSRDGRFIEKIGYYSPITEPADISINEERALYWLQVGAKPSDTSKSLLKKTGVWQKFKAPEQVSEEEASEVEADDKSETEPEQEEPKQSEEAE